jgi:hypothetical protein
MIALTEREAFHPFGYLCAWSGSSQNVEAYDKALANADEEMAEWKDRLTGRDSK